MINFIIVASITSIVIGGLFYLIFYKPISEKNERLERRANYFDTMYLQKQGWTSTYDGIKLSEEGLSYHLRSWDGGVKWYATKTDDKGLIILGEAEKIYPKLLHHLDAWDKLTEYAKKNGGVKGADDITGINLLKDAGFTVTKKEN